MRVTSCRSCLTVFLLLFQGLAIEDGESVPHATRETSVILIESDVEQVVGAVVDVHDA